jgi:pimeloyl-ACP methyl ester carboxylesterase
MKEFKLVRTSFGPILLMIMITSFLSSCNIVRLRDKALVRQLKRKEIRSYVYEGDSVKIKYWMGGQGPAVLLLHGFGGNALTTYNREMKELSKDHLVIAPDLLWFGESHATRSPSLSAQTHAMLELLDQLNIDQLKIVGQSYGGFIAIDMINRKSKNFLKVCIANCPGTTYDVTELDIVCRNFGVTTIDELFILKKPEQFQRLVNLSTYRNPWMPRFLLSQSYYEYFAANHEEQKELLTTLQNENERHTDTTFLDGIETMVLWGEKDELFSLKEGAKFALAVGAKLEVIPKAGHAPQADRPFRFTRVVTEYIRK